MGAQASLRAGVHEVRSVLVLPNANAGIASAPGGFAVRAHPPRSGDSWPTLARAARPSRHPRGCRRAPTS